MKMNKKLQIITVVALCTALLPVYKTFADKLDDAFRGGVKVEYIDHELGIDHFVQTIKWAWASTRKEENGNETYQGRHYLRCYKEGIRHFDTGKRWENEGFLLEGPKIDVSGIAGMISGGGFKACYGN